MDRSAHHIPSEFFESSVTFDLPVITATPIQLSIQHASDECTLGETIVCKITFRSPVDGWLSLETENDQWQWTGKTFRYLNATDSLVEHDISLIPLQIGLLTLPTLRFKTESNEFGEILRRGKAVLVVPPHWTQQFVFFPKPINQEQDGETMQFNEDDTIVQPAHTWKLPTSRKAPEILLPVATSDTLVIQPRLSVSNQSSRMDQGASPANSHSADKNLELNISRSSSTTQFIKSHRASRSEMPRLRNGSTVSQNSTDARSSTSTPKDRPSISTTKSKKSSGASSFLNSLTQGSAPAATQSGTAASTPTSTTTPAPPAPRRRWNWLNVPTEWRSSSKN